MWLALFFTVLCIALFFGVVWAISEYAFRKGNAVVHHTKRPHLHIWKNKA